MIVDRSSLDVRPAAPWLLGEAPEVARGDMGWSNELVAHVLEVKNRQPHPRLEMLVGAFQAEVDAINARLDGIGAQLMPGGMHPWMDPRQETQLWPHDAAELYADYDRLFDCRRHGWANLQSIHVNLPFADAVEFARLHAAVRLALPILPALAASSPFADGRGTGFLDFRLENYRAHQMRVPSSMGALIPEPVATPADYASRILAPMYDDVRAAGAPLLAHEWFNARGAIPRFERNAIEIRVLDTQECPLADLAIVAAVVALVRRFYDLGPARESAMATEQLADIFLACLRDADRAAIRDERYLALLDIDTPCPAGALWARLIETMLAEGRLAPIWAEPLQRIAAAGPLARRLLDSLGDEAEVPARDSLRARYAVLCQCLRQGTMYPPP